MSCFLVNVRSNWLIESVYVLIWAVIFCGSDSRNGPWYHTWSWYCKRLISACFYESEIDCECCSRADPRSLAVFSTICIGISCKMHDLHTILNVRELWLFVYLIRRHAQGNDWISSSICNNNKQKCIMLCILSLPVHQYRCTQCYCLNYLFKIS